MNPIAKNLNKIIEKGNPNLMEMLSDMGKNLFFPKGILSQSAEAKEKAHKLNATIGIAKECGETMHFPSADEGTNIIAVTDDSYFGLFFEDQTLKEGCQKRY